MCAPPLAAIRSEWDVNLRGIEGWSDDQLRECVARSNLSGAASRRRVTRGMSL